MLNTGRPKGEIFWMLTVRRCACAVAMLIGLLWGCVSAARAADWTMTVDDDGGVRIAHHGAPVCHAGYVFWAEKWDWSSVRASVDYPSGDGPIPIKLTVPKLNLLIDAEAKACAEQAASDLQA